MQIAELKIAADSRGRVRRTVRFCIRTEDLRYNSGAFRFELTMGIDDFRFAMSFVR